MSEIKLKQCPFCGGEAEIIGSDKYSDYLAVCQSCGASSDYFVSREKAVKAWNRRVD